MFIALYILVLQCFMLGIRKPFTISLYKSIIYIEGEVLVIIPPTIVGRGSRYGVISPKVMQLLTIVQPA